MNLQDLYESTQTCPECGGPAFSTLLLAEKKDACYSKVRSRYKVWPSAYASGALVQCRKKGAANWGNKSESVAEGYGMEFYSDAQHLKELWFAVSLPAAIAVAGGVNRLVNLYKTFTARRAIEDLEKKGIRVDAQTYAEVEPMLAKLRQAISDGDGRTARSLSDEILKTVTFGKLRQVSKPPTAEPTKPEVSETLNLELVEEFNLIENIINDLADYNNVDAEVIWEDLESLTDDELYVFAVTTPIMEDWQKVNKKDRTDGMSRKAVKAYRREHPGSKLKTAVTTKPSKLKRGSKASKRRSSYCSRSRGQMKMHNISCAKTPDKAICKARRRWNCESMEHGGTMVAEAGSPAQQAAIAIAMKKAGKKPQTEGAEFGSKYAEQLAQQVFNHNPNIEDENQVLDLGYNISKNDLGSRAQGMFRDEDFPSDFVSAYFYLQKQGVAEGQLEEIDRRGFLRGLGAAAMAGATGSAMAQSQPVDASQAFANMRKDDPRVQHNKDIDEMARAIYDQMVTLRGQPMDRRQQNMWMTIAREKAAEKLAKYAPGRPAPQSQSSGFPSQGSERRVSRNIDNFESQVVAEVSDATLTSYLTKVDADARKHPSDPTKRPAQKRNKSVAGFSRAFNKLDARKAQDLAPRVGETTEEDKDRYEQGARDVVKGADPDHIARVRKLDPETLRQHVAYAWERVNRGEYKLNRPNLEETDKDTKPEVDYDDDYQDMVSRVGKLAKKQEAERGPVDLAKLAQRLRDIDSER